MPDLASSLAGAPALHATRAAQGQGPEGIGGIDLVAVDEDGTLVFVDATVRIGTDGFPEAVNGGGDEDK